MPHQSKINAIRYKRAVRAGMEPKGRQWNTQASRAITDRYLRDNNINITQEYINEQLRPRPIQPARTERGRLYRQARQLGYNNRYQTSTNQDFRDYINNHNQSERQSERKYEREHKEPSERYKLYKKAKKLGYEEKYNKSTVSKLKRYIKGYNKISKVESKDFVKYKFDIFHSPISTLNKILKKKLTGKGKVVINFSDFSLNRDFFVNLGINNDISKRELKRKIKEILDKINSVDEAGSDPRPEDEDGNKINITIEKLFSGNITINYRQNNGGCNKKSKTNRILNGEFNVISYPSDDNNCGLRLLKELNISKGKYAKIRRDFNIKPKAMISPEKLIEIARSFREDTKLKIINLEYENLTETDVKYSKYEIEEFKADSIPIIILSDKHYYLFIGLTEKQRKNKKKCNMCGRRYYNKHTCNPNRITYYNRQKKPKYSRRNNLTFDIETRDDFTNIKTVKRIVNGKELKTEFKRQVAVELSICYKNEKVILPDDMKVNRIDEYFTTTFFGLDCVEQFLDFLLLNNKEDINFNIMSFNGSNFDNFFIYNTIQNNEKYYNYFRDKTKIIKSTSLMKFDFSTNSFIDVRNFTQGSLSGNCKAYNIKHKKIKNFTIDGKELTNEDLMLLKTDLSPEEWINWLNCNNEYKNAYIRYCEYDCLSLLELWNTFDGEIYRVLSNSEDLKQKFLFCRSDMNLNCDDAKKKTVIEPMSSFPTLQSYIMKIWKSSFERIKINKNGKKMIRSSLPTLNDEHYEFIKKCKTGGVSHVQYTGYHESDVALIDVVSLYVSAMLLYDFPSGQPMEVDRWVKGRIGYYEVENIIYKPEHRIALIPRKVEGKSLDWDVSKNKIVKSGYCSSILLEQMEKEGIKFTVKRGLIFPEFFKPYNELLNVFWNEKKRQDSLKDTKNYNKALRSACKLCGNSLYGKQMQEHVVDEWVDVGKTGITDKQFNAFKDSKFCNGKVMVKCGKKITKAPIHLGVAILDYSKIIMREYYNMIGHENIIASETDSIYCPIDKLKPLYESKDDRFCVGKELCNMDVEFGDNIVARNSYFLGKKVYYLQEFYDLEKKEKSKVEGHDDKMRFKGVPSKNLSPSVYKELYTKNECLIEGITNFRKSLFDERETCVRITRDDKKFVKVQDKPFHYDENLNIVQCKANCKCGIFNQS